MDELKPEPKDVKQACKRLARYERASTTEPFIDTYHGTKYSGTNDMFIVSQYYQEIRNQLNTLRSA